MDSEKINLIIDEEECDYYNVQIIKDIQNKKNNFLNIKLEFSDHLCIYELEKEELIYEISYYNILSWLYGKKQFGINYQDYKKNKYQLIFQVENSFNIVNSIKKKVNELLEYTGEIEKMK